MNLNFARPCSGIKNGDRGPCRGWTWMYKAVRDQFLIFSERKSRCSWEQLRKRTRAGRPTGKISTFNGEILARGSEENEVRKRSVCSETNIRSWGIFAVGKPFVAASSIILSITSLTLWIWSELTWSKKVESGKEFCTSLVAK